MSLHSCGLCELIAAETNRCTQILSGLLKFDIRHYDGTTPAWIFCRDFSVVPADMKSCKFSSLTRRGGPRFIAKSKLAGARRW